MYTRLQQPCINMHTLVVSALVKAVDDHSLYRHTLTTVIELVAP